MLDMERKEVLALLENKSSSTASANIERRSASPYATARSPVRSMLDIEEEPSSSSTNKVSPPRQGPVRSMLDTGSPLPITARSKPSGSNTVPSSPSSPSSSTFNKERSPSQSSHYRSMSDAAFNPTDFGPRASSSRNDPTSGYQFSGIYNQLGGHPQQMPLRATQKNTAGVKKSVSGSLGEALRSADLSGLQLPGERGRNASSGLSNNLSGRGSKSPHNRLTSRSRSPATFSPQLPSGKAYLNDGQVLDINNAYRRLSDANLAVSGGSLSQLARRKQAEEPGEGRLIKDYLGPDGEHLDSSEDDEPYSTDDEDRGRKKTPRPLSPDASGEGRKNKSRSPLVKGGRTARSLLAAAEEERMY